MMLSESGDAEAAGTLKSSGIEESLAAGEEVSSDIGEPSAAGAAVSSGRGIRRINDTVSPDEDEELEKYLAYIHTVYSVFGFGLWTVELKDAEAGVSGAIVSEAGVSGAIVSEAGTSGAIASGTGVSEAGVSKIIGRCGLQPIADEDSPLGRIELGYLIDRQYRGRGYGYEACRAILEFAFERLELDEVYAVIDENNLPSLKLAQKLGFSRIKDNLWRIKAAD